MDRADARMDKFEKSLDGIRKLITTGMKMNVKAEQEQREIRADHKALRGEQKELVEMHKSMLERQARIDRKFERLIDILTIPFQWPPALTLGG